MALAKALERPRQRPPSTNNDNGEAHQADSNRTNRTNHGQTNFHCSKHGPNKSHDTKDCKAIKKEQSFKREPSVVSKRNPECFHCKRKGHYATDCPDKQQTAAVTVPEPLESTDDLFPFVDDSDEEGCSATGIAHSTAILIPVTVNGTRVQAFVDSGSSCTMMHPSIADQLAIKRHKAEPIGTWAEGQSAESALATSPITISTTNSSTSVTPRIAPINVGAPLLLGRKELQALGIVFTGLPIDYPTQPPTAVDTAWDPEQRPTPVMKSTPLHDQERAVLMEAIL